MRGFARLARHKNNLPSLPSYFRYTTLAVFEDLGEMPDHRLVRALERARSIIGRQAFDLFEELLYGDQPAGWDTAGYPHTVKNIKREDIVKYKESHYLTSNAVVCVAGNIEPEVAFRKIGKAFAKMPQGNKLQKLKVKEEQSAPLVRFKKKDVDQTHIRLGVRAYNMFDQRRYALAVLNTILGGNWSSRLFTELREKLGLTYYVRSMAEEYTDTGYLIAAAGVPHDKVEKAVSKMAELFKGMRTKGVSSKDITFAKEYIRGSLALAFESTDEVATYLASQELFYKKIWTPEEELKRIEAVTKSDIMKVAREVFTNKNLNLAVVGDIKDSKRLKRVLTIK